MRKIILLFFLSSVISYSQSFEKHHLCKYKQPGWGTDLQRVYYPGDPNIDVTYYGINLHIYHESETISGSVGIRFRPVGKNINSMFIDLMDTLSVDFVKRGEYLLDFNHANDKIEITLDKEYTPLEEVSITVFYHGKPVVYGGDGMDFSTANGKPCMWTNSEPFGAPYWYPCKDDPSDKADSISVTVTTDSALTVVSNGLLHNIIDNGNGTSTTTWKHGYPIAHYLVTVLTGDYHKYTNYFHYSETDSMPVENYTYTGQFGTEQKEAYDKQVEMLEIFSDLFGVYPFYKEKYGFAQYKNYMSAMEHQTITTMSAWHENVMVHELSHHWFGNKITCMDWNNIWLNEGFASYSEYLYKEVKYGIKEYTKDTKSLMEYLITLENSVYVYDIYKPYRVFSEESYSKGAFVLHMLRSITGDSVFFSIIREYNNKENLIYGNAVTDDFKYVAEEVSGMDLDYFFDQWVYGTGHPVYKITWDHGRIDGRYKVFIDLDQTTTGDVEFFKMPVEFGFVTVSGDTLVKQVKNDQPEQYYTILLEEDVTDIIFDPNANIIHEIEITTGVKEEEEAPAEYSLGQNYPNPFNPSTTIKYSLPESGIVKLKLYDILGNKITELVSGYSERGNYKYDLNAEEYGLSSGVYIYSMEVNDFRQVRKLALVK